MVSCFVSDFSCFSSTNTVTSAMSPVVKYPPIPTCLLNGTFKVVKPVRESIDDQLEKLYGNDDDVDDEPKQLIDLPTTLIFYESTEDNNFEAYLPVVNRTTKRLTYCIYPSNPLFQMNPAIGLLKPKQCSDLQCTTDRTNHDARLTQFKGGHICVQVMEYPPAASTMLSAVRTHWAKFVGNSTIESHWIKKLHFLKSPVGGYTAVMEVMAGFEPSPYSGDQVEVQEEAQADRPNWFDLQENWEHVGITFQPGIDTLKKTFGQIADRKASLPPRAYSTVVVPTFRGTPQMFLYVMGGGVLWTLALICYFLKKLIF